MKVYTIITVAIICQLLTDQLELINGCGKSLADGKTRQFKIANGDIVKNDNKWPWMAALFRNDFTCSCQQKNIVDNFCFMCGASIIGSRHLLLAAHCFGHLSAQAALNFSKIHLGSDNYSSPDVIVPAIKHIHIHSNFSRENFADDIAIIELIEPLEFNERIQPICLPNKFNEIICPACNNKTNVQTGTIAGWGHQYDEQKNCQPEDVEPEMLRDGSDRFISLEECINKLGVEMISQKNICLQSGHQHALQGDSGGPLFLNLHYDDDQMQEAKNSFRWTQVGFTSFTIESVGARNPVVYTRITAFCNWIQEITLSEVKCID